MPEAGQTNPNVIWRVVDGEAILLDTTTGYHFSFDSIGTEIWEGLQQGSTAATARSTAIALFRDSVSSYSASESATTPAPACT